MQSNLQKFIAFILGVLGSALLAIPLMALLSLVFYCVYNCFLLNFPSLPVIYYHQWIPVALLCYVINIILPKHTPQSEEELKFKEQYTRKIFIDKLKWYIILILISLVYGMVY